ncbi:hypothetical protein HZS55_22220 [Halosimplex rubrum]|uniref:Uncharacterized protein n=1 Tax=Halosimplex rubrum TaxID=869889 RepID=A0A7D5P7L1_9EURY|nr:hypothetical protein [Halosimplex rubrum]QLH79845.1 hypothetical protein HZS55_22220 [Halosimplex rubrum]
MLSEADLYCGTCERSVRREETARREPVADLDPDKFVGRQAGLGQERFGVLGGVVHRGEPDGGRSHVRPVGRRRQGTCPSNPPCSSATLTAL